MPADLVWTREAPTCAGWWFRRLMGTSDPSVVDVVYWQPWMSPPPDGYEWSGPIPLPKEAM